MISTGQGKLGTIVPAIVSYTGQALPRSELFSMAHDWALDQQNL